MTSYNSGDDSTNITDTVILEAAKMVFQKIVCLTLNIGILDMKDGCPKKPTKDKQTKKPTKDKQKTSVLVYWVRGYARQMIFLPLLILFALGALNIQCGQRAFILSHISKGHFHILRNSRHFYIKGDGKNRETSPKTGPK